MSNGYLGSSKLETSKANQELIPASPENWTSGYRLVKFSFINNEACTVTVNKKTTLYLRTNQGFEIDRGDAPITSFVIKEANVTYNFIAMF